MNCICIILYYTINSFNLQLDELKGLLLGLEQCAW